jgi:hypothetical protein
LDQQRLDRLLLDQERVADATRFWVRTVVVDLNLCPFARRELNEDRIRFKVTESASESQLLHDLQIELNFLETHRETETTLLIHPAALLDFADYNQFLDEVDQLLASMQLEGVIQIASFHPYYQFDGTEVDAAENYTNRSPYPMLHLIREVSLAKAIAQHGDTQSIPESNIKKLNEMGVDEIRALMEACFNQATG